MAWVVETLDARVDAELDTLPRDMRARFVRISELIEQVGLQHVHEPHVKHLEGELWEMRMTGKNGISRALYVAERGNRIIILRVFIKKTRKTPRREIEIALERRKDIS
jgi:phage-related protein